MNIALIVIGFLAGILSGMFGIGGGIVIVPALTLALGFGLNEATGTSLAALLLPVGIFAVLAYHRAGMVRLPIVVPIVLGLIGGGFFGAQIALALPVVTLRQLYGLFALWIGWRFAEPRQVIAAHRAARAGTAPPPASPPPAEAQTSFWVLLALGLVAGVLSGMFGIGGGIVIVPVLVALLRFDQKVAVGTSLGALLLPVGAGGVLAYYQAGKLDLAVAAFVALGLLGGAFVGARIALGLPSATVRRLYGVFLLVVGLRFLLTS